MNSRQRRRSTPIRLQLLSTSSRVSMTALALSNTTQQKFLKRGAEEPGGVGVSGGRISPPNKVARTSSTAEGVTKISLEIVQQLEFTTSAADSQPQQISTNVTVKALTNASVKSEAGTPLLECKREPDHDFADLDQCAAALEKDAAANFPGFSDLIGDEGGVAEIITSDAFKDLISDISDYHFMNDFDFEDTKYADTLSASVDNNHSLLNNVQLKTEDGRIPDTIINQQQNAGGENQVAPSGPGRGIPQRQPGGYGAGELSPAAQTLKQMAEQHQHKQMGLGNRSVRSPYELHDYLNNVPTPAAFRKQDVVKQEVVFPGSYKPYSPYGSPGSAGHGSPGYLPRGSFGGPSPPRPPSGPPPQPTQPSANLHINQAQHLHISHPSHAIQVSAGQQMQLSGELQGTHVSVAAQQGMYFGQTTTPHQNTPSPHHQNQSSNGDTYSVSQSQTINFTQQTLRQRQQQAQAANSSPMSANGSPMNQQTNPQNIPSPVNNANINTNTQTIGNMNNLGISNNLMNNNPNMVTSMGNIVNMNNNVNMSREQHAKILQQQMLRTQQAMHQGGQTHLRPPPPDYKATQNPLTAGVHNVTQPRYPTSGIRRATHQTINPSAPMMRPGNVMYGTPGVRYTNPGMMATHPDWRHHLVMQQQQQQSNINFPRHNTSMSNFPHQGGFPVTGPNVMQQQQQLHQQILRSHQQILPTQAQHQQQQQQQLPSHLIAHQNQGLSMQSQSSNINMNQSQSISIQHNNINAQDSSSTQPNGAPTNSNPVSNITNQFSPMQNTVNNASSSFPGQSTEFNLDFLENIPSETNNYSTQDFLNSLESEYNFNIQDMF